MKNRYITIKMMDKYAQLKCFYHERQLQVYMYAFLYVDTEKMLVEEQFTATNTFVVNYN